MLTAIRDAESRVMFCGYNPLHYKLFIWTLSAVLCGIAGALYVPQVGIINPGEMSPANSIEIAIWAAVGGRGTLVGPVLGAFIVNGAKSWFTVGVPGVLAVLPRPAVHPGHAVPAAGRDRAAAARRVAAVMSDVVVHGVDAGPAGALAGAGMRVAGPDVDTTHGPILYLDGVSVSFDGFKALNDLSLTIDDGELRCIIGPNGAGKTTMMDVITGKTRPDAGTAFFGQTIDLTQLTEAEIAHAGIGRKFQKPTVFERHSVFENLELAMKADKRVRTTVRARLSGADLERIAETLELIQLRDQVHRPAGAAVARPEAVAGDRHAADAGAAAAAARRAGRRHDRRGDDAHRRAVPVARRAALGGGRRARHGLHRPDRAQGHRAARGQRAGRGVDGRRAGRSARDRSLPRALTRMLTVTALNQYYGGSHTLRDVAFEAPSGAVTAILGRNGVGKTTLLKCLAGLLPVRSGAIGFDGADVTRLPPHQRARLGLGYVPQGREIFPRLTVEENLRLGLATRPPGTPIPPRIFEMFPVLADMLQRRGGDLSGGQQQQLAIGRALAMGPKLLVLDEPTEGIQPSIIKDIERAIRRLAAEGEMAILLVEQYYDFARSLADRYVVLSRGEVIKAGKGADMERDGVRACLTV